MSVQLTLVLLSFSLWTYGTCNPSCPTLKPGMTNVHLVCHTHDDVGWLKTVDQYYYGSKKDITWVGVQYILDSVIPSLLRNPERKFVYVESAFFYRWWDQQDQSTKNAVKGLVEGGQLEFVGGGWSMSDEATTHYNELIDQMTLGLAKLNETFGPAAVPRIAWQIDPFGHSKEQASLFAQMGMDGLFFARIDYDDKSNRWNSKKMEMVWKASNSLEPHDSWLFSGVLPNHYSAPSGFCFDLLCSDDPIMDDPNLSDYNKDEKVQRFLDTVEDEQEGYTTSNIIMTMGDDFHYVNAEVYFKNLDKLIKYVNELQASGSTVNVFYSTPSCYLDALHDANLFWTTKSDDFFPYASGRHDYWTGYFTSRPTFKGFIKLSNNVLQAVKQMSALAGLGRRPSLEKLAEALGVCQHHDAVTGTAKQHVTDDYSKTLSDGIAAVQDIINEGFGNLTGSSGSAFYYCPLLNISSCSATETAPSFVVNVYNSLSRAYSYYVRVPVASALNYQVTDQLGNVLETQLVPLQPQVENIPGRESAAKYDLVFFAPDLPPLGAEQFFVTSAGSAARGNFEILPRKIHSNEDTVIRKGRLQITLDAKTKTLKSVGLTSKAVQMDVTQRWLWYAGFAGDNNGDENRASGAYIFRPDGDPTDLGVPNVTYYDGGLVSEIHQEWASWVTQVLRLYRDKNYMEMEWLVGPIPVEEDGVGKEVVTRYEWQQQQEEEEEGAATNGTFYTDANGREMQKRIKDHRDTWELSSTEPVSQNYYPVTSRLILESTNGMGQAALLNDRPQGGTSLSDGAMELMVHRRLLYDDAKGVSEALNEKAYGQGLVARGRHFMIHSDFNPQGCDFGCQHRSLGEEVLLQPIITISNPSSFVKKQQKNKKDSGLSAVLPSNMRILTLEPWREGEWLLRLENYYEINESSHSGTSSVYIAELFSDWEITHVDEVTLGANQLKSDNHRLTWNIISEAAEDGPAAHTPNTSSGGGPTDEEVDSSVKELSYEFSPMQIRSFIVKVTPLK